MTLTQITLAFFSLMAVIVAAMLVHGYIDKRRITKNFKMLAHSFGGEIDQGNPLVYPRFLADRHGRRVSVFFQVVKVGRRHILYLIYSMSVPISLSLLLLKEQFFHPTENETQVTEISGPILPKLDTRYLARSKDGSAASALYERAGLSAYLTPIEEFTSLLIGPDSIIAGKPYDGLSDILPEALSKNITHLEEMALAIEKVAT